MLTKCVTNKCAKNTFTCVMIFWSVVSFGLAIYGAIQLNALSKYQDRDGGVWNFCVGACVVDFLFPVACLIGLRSFVNDQGNNQILAPIFILELAVTAWAIIVYHYNSYHNYIEFWNENALGLMVAVYAHYAYVCIHLFLVIFVIFSYFCFYGNM